MAEAAVGYVLEKLDALLKKAQELYDVSGEIKQMQLQLGFIKAFLKDADSKRNRDELVKEWVNQIRHMAHKIEDVIDTFLVEIEENRQKSSTWYSKISMGSKRPYNRLKLSEDLKEITEELKTIFQLRIDLGIKNLDAGSEEHGQHLLPFRPAKPFAFDESEVVGLEDDKRKIIEQLLDRNISRRMVLSIVGTGGLGKTTLAQKIYKSVESGGQFDLLAWLSISQKFNLNDLFREILYLIEPEKRYRPMTDDDLLVKIKSTLRGKRYLIILDDVWSTDVWEKLKIAIPDPNNMSRIIITSRFKYVANAADCNTEPHQLSYLNPKESLALLFRKAFQQPIQPENYPLDLLEVAKRLTKRCDGLPLALVVLGGILSRRKPNYPAWTTMEETMDWHDEDGNKCSQVLAMSYENLPYELKPCFLYFACFPEDYKISGMHITRMWMAEGFISKDGAGTIEDRAEKCLQELVQRCLIQVTKKFWNGYCKYCSMHDLLRDLAISKAKDENFFTVFSKEDVNNLDASKPRRAALQFCTPTKDDIYSENTRSLLCFGQKASNDSGFGLLHYSGFRLLRVLTLQNVNMTNFTRRQWPKGLVHLRYLGLRGCHIPQDIFKKFSFYNIETIDLKGSHIDKTIGETLDLGDVVIPTLRHAYGNFSFHLPLKWNKHTNLQTIMDVPLQIELVVELGFCINLRTLVISFDVYLDNERVIKEWKNLKSVLGMTKQLVYLSIETMEFLPFGGTKDLPCHGKIQKLVLKGKWERNICVPSVEMFPTNLTKLKLTYCELQEDPMPILEMLQSLRILYLDYFSYVGTEFICSTGGFPNLETLKLKQLSNLHHWDIKEGAMPILRHLKIHYCDKLHVLPELQKVQTLQELTVYGPSRELWEGMQMQGKDVHKILHIPSRHIRNYKLQ